MSWIIINENTNKAVLETYSDEYATRLNAEEGYKAIPAMQYLQGLNDGEYSKSN